MDSRSYITSESSSLSSLDYDADIVEFKSEDVLTEVEKFLAYYPNRESLIKIDFKKAKEA